MRHLFFIAGVRRAISGRFFGAIGAGLGDDEGRRGMRHRWKGDVFKAFFKLSDYKIGEEQKRVFVR